ncbi:unnamed protein product, partial [Adineta ricciae]
MIIVQILFILIWCSLVNTRYVLYYSNEHKLSYPTFDCLYVHYYISSKLIDLLRDRPSSQLDAYCRRPENYERENTISYETDENIAKIISFYDLKEQGVTSEQLLAWFAPIDIVEKYEKNDITSNFFYNCSSPWFGSFCQYKFPHDPSLSFTKIVQHTLGEQSSAVKNETIGTCYRFVNGCNSELWPMCLDWRQICNGLIDCDNGEDEQWCDQLEITKCNKNEYRCHYGGQCIP